MLHISSEAYEKIRRHGELIYPCECCGVLLGTTRDGEPRVARAEPAGNASAGNHRNRYEIAPQELIRIDSEARRSGLEIVGFYHSHPDHEAHWSATDLAEAHWLECSYVITAVERGRATVTRSFRLAGAGEDEKRFEEEGIAVDIEPD